MRILIILIFLLSNSFADETTDFKNLIIKKDQKKYEDLSFLDADKKQVNLDDYRGKLVLLNFWASWCAPCKEEMPSLDSLQSNKNLNNLQIFPINVGQDNEKKAKDFFEELDIKTLNIYFDTTITLAKKFQLRGIPTTILISKDGYEFARIIGSIDFESQKFIKWLSKYN
ncbi:TlpA family protein disulfide reductase [Candidatus Pelagibacter sp.]|jgi:thiol-disulfide isomerase/thioredoxin|nr:TlpA family protein disulfide reductase [Candidatus Pelagibacter sp.]|tara:strand:+ start:1361 stop:1870 length:510 start_codon:yes stop_codon:yes gene_type:complete